MALFDIVRMNSARYRMNPVMIVPPLIATIFPLITSLLLAPPIPKAFAPELMAFIFVASGVLLLNLMISFLALLGQASMAGMVVVEEKTRLTESVGHRLNLSWNHCCPKNFQKHNNKKRIGGFRKREKECPVVYACL